MALKGDINWIKDAHNELAGLINDSRITRLYTTGPFMEYLHNELEDNNILVLHSDDHEQLLNSIYHDMEDGDLVYIQSPLGLNIYKNVCTKLEKM